MHVVVLLPRAEVHAAGRRLSVALAASFAAGLLLLWLFQGLLLHRHLVRPVERLTAAARAFVREDLTQALTIPPRPDEIGALATALEDVRRHLRQSSAEAHRLINADALTGLPNRRYITQRLAAEIARLARRGEGCFALMFIDLDNFKSINDSMGHKAGDRLVVKVAQRLVQAIRAYDSVVPPDPASPLEASDGGGSLVARLGGDEFLLILNDLKQPEDAARIVRRLYTIFEEPVGIDSLQIYVSMSIGIVLHPGSGETAEQLIKNADVAMYAAKGAGKNQYRFYEASMEQSARRTLEIESRLRSALSGKGLSLGYQPLFSLPDTRLCGAEVLVRWQDPDLGSISPAEFVPVAESCGLIHELGSWVLIEALTQFVAWRREGLPVGRLSINLSTHQVEAEGLAERVLTLLERKAIAPRDIEFEITETAVFRHREVAVRNLTTLREAGVRFALDDFGTGYSSLAWVQHFTVDAVKIDRSFVQAIATHDRHRAVVASVVELCRRLALDVVAEGVETAEQVAALTALGCTHAQGYLFGRPVDPVTFAAVVRGSAEAEPAGGGESLRPTG
jgi:predicted signal transduction protein with EAL and GGDEF domain